MKNFPIMGLLVSLTTGVAMAQGGNLTVNATNFKNAKGTAKFWLFRSADGFPSDEKKAVQCVEAPITGSTSHYVFENLPAGTYAVGVTHDENGNHQFDTNFMGIPREAYGTTNGVRGGVSGPPKYEPASFIHAKTSTTVTVAVK